MSRALAAAVALVLALAPGAATARDVEVVVSVAISMKEVVEELGRRFVSTRPGVVVRYNVGASGELQKQIEAGAPVDVFVSAAERQMDELDRKGLLAGGTRRVFATNALVVIVPAEGAIPLAAPADLLQPPVRRIVIGNPRTVPAGQYAEESLIALGLRTRLTPKLVFAENVRQALEYVARGEVDAGFVYATDAALRRDHVKEAFRPPASSHRPIRYPVAVVGDTKRRELAGAFVGLLAGTEARAVLVRHGFGVPGGGP
jgi:molybdate transport system substrate-binding protein